jgi:hypothetical protein
MIDAGIILKLGLRFQVSGARKSMEATGESRLSQWSKGACEENGENGVGSEYAGER